jgi:hypothetical protein
VSIFILKGRVEPTGRSIGYFVWISHGQAISAFANFFKTAFCRWETLDFTDLVVTDRPLCIGTTKYVASENIHYKMVDEAFS